MKDVGGVEIDEEAYPLIQQAEVGEELLGEDGFHFFDRLEFDNDLIFHDEVEAKFGSQHVSFINDGDLLLALNREAALVEFED